MRTIPVELRVKQLYGNDGIISGAKATRFARGCLLEKAIYLMVIVFVTAAAPLIDTLTK